MSVATASAKTDDSQIAYFDVHLTPSLDQASEVKISVGSTVPASATALVVPVAADGEPPTELGLVRATLTAAGFEARVGQTLVIRCRRSDAGGSWHRRPGAGRYQQAA